MSAIDAANVRSVTDNPVSEEVVYAVAEATGADPTEMPPLYDVIDPQSLDRLFRGRQEDADSNARVIFTMHGCEVTVHADREIEVTPLDAADGAGPA